MPIVRNGQGQYGCDLTFHCKGRGFWSEVCTKAPSFNFHLNIDLKPYLKTGINEIWTRVIVGTAGEGWMKIIAKQKCCMSWRTVE